MKNKIKKILIIFFCSFLVINSSIGSYQKARAEGLGAALFFGGAAETIAAGGTASGLAAASAVIPMVLVALGIAGVGYIASNEELQQEIWNRLQEKGTEVTDLLHTVGSSAVKSVEFTWQAGKCYIADPLVKAIAEIGLDLGLFEGVTSGSDYGLKCTQEIIEGIPLGIYDDDRINQCLRSIINTGIYPLTFFKFVSDGFMSWPIVDDKGKTIGSWSINVSNVTEPVYVYLWGSNYSDEYGNNWTNNLNIYYVSAGPFSCSPGGQSGSGVIAYNNGLESIPNYFAESVQSGYEKKVCPYNPAINYRYDKIGALRVISDYLNNGSEVVEGIPVTDNIPVEQDGSITLPQWIEDSITVDDSVSWPISLPEDYNPPVVWPIDDPFPTITDEEYDMVADPDWDWPVDLPNDPAVPDDTAQDDAQEGTIDTDITYNPEIPDFTSVGQFLVDSNIVDRFPFCIPFDMAEIVSNLASERAPPVYTWNYNINGVEGSVNIDLSRYNDLAVVFRNGVLLIFIVGLAAGSKQFLKV